MSPQAGPVLVATKPFSAHEASLLVARSLARQEERPLRVVSVLEPPLAPAFVGTALPFSTPSDEWEREALGAQLQQEVGDIGQSGTPISRADVEVLEGPSAPSVVEAARRCDARVIVVGTGKHDLIGRYIYGERALQIIRLADRPVLVVPPHVSPLPLTIAVVAVDFSVASVRAARAVLPMLATGGRLVLVHVKTGVNLHQETAGWWNDAYERHCADLFAQFQRQLPALPGITIESKFLRGDPVRTTIEHARSIGAGVIACGRLGHSLLERVLLGSVSAGLVRQAPCPVLVAPELSCDIATP
jgi:nucleotide-binding universal stress UspA family protein